MIPLVAKERQTTDSWVSLIFHLDFKEVVQETGQVEEPGLLISRAFPTLPREMGVLVGSENDFLNYSLQMKL